MSRSDTSIFFSGGAPASHASVSQDGVKVQKITHNAPSAGSFKVEMKMFIKTELEDWFEAVLNVSSVCTAQYHRHFLLTLFIKDDDIRRKAGCYGFTESYFRCH